MAKVSIITLVYNPKEEFLKVCIESVLNQTFKDIEFILVDNGATGNNSEILENYSKNYPQIKLIKFNKNQGFAKAANAALEATTGDYIQLLDSDDWLEENAVEILYNKAIETSADLILFGSDEYDQQKQEYVNSFHYRFSTFPKQYRNKCFNFNDLDKWLIMSTPLQDWNKFVKRELVFDKDNKFDESIKCVLPDVVYSIKNMVNADKIFVINDRLHSYRVNISSSVVKGYSKSDCPYFDDPFMFAEVLSKFMYKSLTPECAKYVVQIVVDHLFGYMHLAHRSQRKRFFDKLRDFILSADERYYSEENLKELPEYSDYKIIKKVPYLLFKLNKFLFFHKADKSETLIRVFGFTVYKKYYSKGYLCKSFFKIFKIKTVDFNGILNYQLLQLRSDLYDYIDFKTTELQQTIYDEQMAVKPAIAPISGGGGFLIALRELLTAIYYPVNFRHLFVFKPAVCSMALFDVIQHAAGFYRSYFVKL